MTFYLKYIIFITIKTGIVKIQALSFMHWNEQQLNLEQHLPLYQIFANHLRACIQSGELKTGTKLPASRELQTFFHLSAITVEHGIKVLTREGWLIRRPRLGTFVAQPEGTVPIRRSRLRVKVVFSNILVMGDTWFEVLFFIEKRLRQNGAELLFERLDLSNPLPACVEITKNCDAVILCGTNPIQLAEALLEQRFPFILVGSPDRKTSSLKKMDALIGDDEAKMMTSIKTLLDMGHRRIAVLCAPEGSMFEQEQKRGLYKASKLYGFDESELQVCTVKTAGIETGDQVGCQILCQENRPTAVLSTDPMLSLGFLYAAGKLGFSVPEDISILSYGGDRTIEFTNPPLTTVGKKNIGVFLSEMLDRLFDQINNPDHKSSNLINRDFPIIFRKSLIQNKMKTFRMKNRKESENERSDR